MEHLGNYAKSKSNNFAVETHGMTYYFSYETLVGVSDANRTVLRENIWGNTTGKHLNAICTGSPRLTEHEFNQAVEMMEKHNRTKFYY
jgi:hypothetical protein